MYNMFNIILTNKVTKNWHTVNNSADKYMKLCKHELNYKIKLQNQNHDYIPLVSKKIYQNLTIFLYSIVFYL